MTMIARRMTGMGEGAGSRHERCVAHFVRLVDGEGREKLEWIAVNSSLYAVDVVFQQLNVTISGVLV
jgi:hypothetical protein